MKSEHYDRYIGVDDSAWDCALELTLRDSDHQVERVIRIPVEDVPGFLDQVTRHGVRCMAVAARRLEVGHCETCANIGLVDVEVRGRTTNTECPDCRHRWPAEPFANAPKIGRLAT